VECDVQFHRRMSGVRRYQDLIAYQVGTLFKQNVFRLVRGSPSARADFRFKTQLQEAARSVPANIAEGFLRNSPGDFARFLDIALGSLGEAEVHLTDGIELEYFRTEACAEAFALARRCLTASIRLKQSQLQFLPPRSRPRSRPKRR
jgi:four helix bundle protein